MKYSFRALIYLTLIAALGLSGCATLDKNHEAPKVEMIGIRKGETGSSTLQFTIQLRIVNPNAEPINLKGLYYELSLEGIEVVTGTANDLPPIEGYSEEIVSVNSAANLMSSARLVHKLINASKDKLNYELKTKLGMTSKWMPSTTAIETGEISLQ